MRITDVATTLRKTLKQASDTLTLARTIEAALAAIGNPESPWRSAAA